MQQHQKYVPLRDQETGKLLPRFLFVSNLETKQPREIVHGNERVLRARLADAKFFYDQDRKTRLETRVPRLAGVVYHSKLGSQLERVERIQLLAGKIAHLIGADPLLTGRAAWLSKADLLTEMVGEFPELQGTMGRYYAVNDGEPKAVADAIEAHYRPRFAGDAIPDRPRRHGGRARRQARHALPACSASGRLRPATRTRLDCVALLSGLSASWSSAVLRSRCGISLARRSSNTTDG